MMIHRDRRIDEVQRSTPEAGPNDRACPIHTRWNRSDNAVRHCGTSFWFPIASGKRKSPERDGLRRRVIAMAVSRRAWKSLILLARSQQITDQ